MEKSLVKKIVALMCLGFAAVTYTVVEVIFRSMASAFGIVQRLYSIDVANHGIPIGLALGVFFVLMFNKKSQEWTEDVVLEVSKVVWPSRKDTVGMTVVVCVMVVIASGILFLFDSVAREVVKLIVQ